MNTPTHIIINAAVAKRFSFPKAYFIMGGLLPDIALYVTGLVSAITLTLQGFTKQQIFIIMFKGPEALYFNDVGWLISYNILQSPTSVAIFTFIGVLAYKYFQAPTKYLWLLAGIWLHVILDLLTHHDDGALIFFPFEWTTRFYSPISYWDPSYFGKFFSVFEFLLFIFLIIYLLKDTRIFNIFKKKQQ